MHDYWKMKMKQPLQICFIIRVELSTSNTLTKIMEHMLEYFPSKPLPMHIFSICCATSILFSMWFLLQTLPSWCSSRVNPEHKGLFSPAAVLTSALVPPHSDINTAGAYSPRQGTQGAQNPRPLQTICASGPYEPVKASLRPCRLAPSQPCDVA